MHRKIKLRRVECDRSERDETKGIALLAVSVKHATKPIGICVRTADSANCYWSPGTGVNNVGIMCGSDPVTSLKVSQCPQEVLLAVNRKDILFYIIFALFIRSTTSSFSNGLEKVDVCHLTGVFR